MKRTNSFSKTFLIGYAVIASLVIVASIAIAVSKNKISASSDQLAGYTESTCLPSTNYLDTPNQYQSWYKEVSPTTNLTGVTKAFSIVKLINNNYVETVVTINVKNTTGSYPDRFNPGNKINISVSSTTDQSGVAGMIAIALMNPDTKAIISSFGSYQGVNVAPAPWTKEFTISPNWNKDILIGFGYFAGMLNQAITDWKCAAVFDAFSIKTDGTAPSQTAIPTATASASATATASATSTILPGQCIDTDNGKNYYVKGIASFASSSGGVQSVADTCDGTGKILTEFFCTPFSATLNIAQSENYTCPNGCSDGACVGNSTLSPELLSITTYKISGGAAQTTVANPPVPPAPATSTVANPPMPTISTTSTVANPPIPGTPTPVATATATVIKTAPPVIQITATPATVATAAAATATEFIVSGIKSGVSFYAIVIAVVLIGGVIIFRIVTAKE